MSSQLELLLAECFPSIAPSPSRPHDCWVALLLHLLSVSDRWVQEFQEPSDAVQVITAHGQREQLISRLRDEHPTVRQHQAQYDERLRDVLTEALAFAWADLRQLGAPRFDYSEGMPDIHVEDFGWIEAKTIHNSNKDREFWAKQRVGDVLTGTGVVTDVNSLPEGLRNKLESIWEDAMRKFSRCPPGRGVIYVHIASLDWDLSRGFTNEETRAQSSVWADSKRSAKRQVDIVLSYDYSWRHPFRDPFNPVESRGSP